MDTTKQRLCFHYSPTCNCSNKRENLTWQVPALDHRLHYALPVFIAMCTMHQCFCCYKYAPNVKEAQMQKSGATPYSVTAHHHCKLHLFPPFSLLTFLFSTTYFVSAHQAIFENQVVCCLVKKVENSTGKQTNKQTQTTGYSAALLLSWSRSKKDPEIFREAN